MVCTGLAQKSTREPQPTLLVAIDGMCQVFSLSHSLHILVCWKLDRTSVLQRPVTHLSDTCPRGTRLRMRTQSREEPRSTNPRSDTTPPNSSLTNKYNQVLGILVASSSMMRKHERDVGLNRFHKSVLGEITWTGWYQGPQSPWNNCSESESPLACSRQQKPTTWAFTDIV